ncbi:hypothetical protein BSG1_07084 [Bacillus sp. SG-1]|nr:hypothetical protein BSG1_07084 [Bacillus sp. SG-1]
MHGGGYFLFLNPSLKELLIVKLHIKKGPANAGPKEKGVVKRESPTLCLLIEYPEFKRLNLLFKKFLIFLPFKKALTSIIMINVGQKENQVREHLEK